MEPMKLTEGGGPHTWHFLIALYFALSCIAARFFLDTFVFQRVAVWLLREKVVPRKINDTTRATIAKCRESLWKLSYYGSINFFILKTIYNEPWFTDTSLYFTGWPNQELRLELKLFYMCQCGFYIYSIAALNLWETRRKDFVVMMSHHVITFVLIWYSYITGFFLVGTIILALHDASDVFMEAAKIFKYSGKELGASFCFGLFAISWLILRLIFFPFWVIRRTSYDLLSCLELSKPYHQSLYYVFNTMLLMLVVFHVYWWVLICAMIRRQLRNKGQVGEDIRSDSEDED